MNIGDRIKARRQELKMSQRELAALVGYSNHSTVARIEANKVDLPQSKIAEFAKALHTSPGVLMGWVDEKAGIKNDRLVKTIKRLRTDSEFFEVVELLETLSPEELNTIKNLVSVLGRK